MNKCTSAFSLWLAGLLAVSLSACDSNGDAQQLSELVSIAEAGYTSLVINGDTVIETGSSTQLSLEVFTENLLIGTDISAGRADWSSADTTIAEVDSDTGIVTGGSVDGEVGITARFGNLSATTQVRVSSAELESIVIEVAADSLGLNECSANQFTALGLFQGEAEQRDITDSVVWSVAQPSAAFDEVGLLRVTSADELSVTATRIAFLGRPEVSQTDTVTVLENLQSINIVPDAGELARGSPLQYRAFPVYQNLPDETSEITDNLDWTLPENFAQVDNTLPDKGLVTASSAGDGVLSAACLGTTVSDSLSIVAAGSGEFASLSISPENMAREFPLTVVFQGEEIIEQLIATALFLDQQGGEDVTDDAEWTIDSTSDSSLFVLGNSSGDRGELSIRGVGTVTLTATFVDEDNDDVVFTDTVTVTSQ